jgi:N-acetylmuramoyl-L-alanine amidase/LysM domain
MLRVKIERPMANPFFDSSFPRRYASFAALALASVCLLVAADKKYTVKRNDTLTELARENGLSVGELAKRNDLSKTARLRVGQKLIIPDAETGKEDAAASSLLPKALKKIRVEPGKWKYIVIHHSASPDASVKGMDYYHRVERHMENGLAYHFVIGNGHSMKDGEIAIGHRWKAQLNGGHLASEALNAKSIGICLIGNFDRERPSKRQLDSLRELIEFLVARCHLGPKSVKTHQQINPVYTRCPGRYFPTKSFLKELKQENG